MEKRKNRKNQKRRKNLGKDPYDHITGKKQADTRTPIRLPAGKGITFYAKTLAAMYVLFSAGNGLAGMLEEGSGGYPPVYGLAQTLYLLSSWFMFLETGEAVMACGGCFLYILGTTCMLCTKAIFQAGVPLTSFTIVRPFIPAILVALTYLARLVSVVITGKTEGKS